MATEVYDICVVGAGMIGSSAAKYASVKGCKVCLIGPQEPERKDIADSRDIYGSYYDEGRITRATASLKTWATFAVRSINRYRDIEKESGIPFYKEVGCLTVGQRNGKYITNTRNVSLECCPTLNLEQINHQTALKKFPYITVDQNEECLWESHYGGHINPRRLVAAQQFLARKYGAHIVHQVVARVETLANGLMKVTTDNKQVFYSRKVLLATGTFTAFRDILPKQYNPNITLKTQTVVLAEIHPADVKKHRDMPCFVWEETKTNNHGCYTLPPIQYPDGKHYMKLGHGSLFEKVLTDPADLKRWFCQPAPDYITQGLASVFRHVFPGVKPVSYKADTCVTCHTPTRMPYIDLLTANLGVAIAGNGYAAKSSDEIGKVAADLIVDGKWTYDLPQKDFKFQSKKAEPLLSRL